MQKLISVEDLFKKAFEIYTNNFWGFTKLVLISIAASLVAVLAWAGIFVGMLSHNISLILVFVLIFLILLLVAIAINFIVQISLLYAIEEKDLTIRQYFSKARPVVGSYALVLILQGLVVLGGFILFIIPGVIFSIWFAFSGYIMIFEGKKGVEALKASKALVAGYWWAIFGRLLLMMLAIWIISWVPVLGPLVNAFAVAPFMAIYFYTIYKDLKRIKG